MIGADAIGLTFRILADSKTAVKELDKTGDAAAAAGKKIDKSFDGVDGKKAEKEIKDVAKAADKAGDEFDQFKRKIKDSQDELDDLGSNTLKKLAQNMGLSAESTAKLGAALPLVGTAIVAIGGAAVGAAVGLFKLSQAAAESGKEIDRINKITGFSVETISALKFASENAGSSLSEFEEAFESFAETLNEGARGAEDAREKLIRLGLDPQNAFKDAEGAFARVVQVIASIEDPIVKAAAASDAMGQSSQPLLALFDELGGNVGAYTARLKELGITTTPEAVKQAKEFTRSLNELTGIVKNVAFTFAREFMPEIIKDFRGISQFVLDNRATFKEWAVSVGESFQIVVKGIKAIGELVPTILGPSLTKALGFAASFLLNPTILRTLEIIDRLNNYTQGKGFTQTPAAPPPPAPADAPPTTDKSTGLYDADKFSDAAKKRQEELDKAAKAAREAALQDLETYGARVKAVFEQGNKEAEEALKAGNVTAQKYRDEALKREEIYYNLTKEVNERINKVQQTEITDPNLKRADANKFQAFLEKEEQDHKNRLTAINKNAAEAIKETEKKATDEAKKQQDERVKAVEDASRRRLAIADAEAKKELAILETEERSAADLAEKRGRIGQDAVSRQITELKDALKAQIAGSREYLDTQNQIAVLEIDLGTKRIETAAAVAKAIADEAKASRELFDALRNQAKEAAENLSSFRAEQDRKVLVNTADSSTGKARINALRELERFDLAAAERRRRIAEDEAEREKGRSLERVKGKENEESLKAEIEDAYRNRRLQAEEEFQANLDEIKERARIEVKDAQDNAGGGGSFFGGLFEQLDRLEERFGTFGAAVVNLKEIVGGAFDALAQGLESAIASSILSGDSFGAALKKITAQVLAQVAAQSAVLAIFELAKGFAALFFNPAEAFAHFKAAALFGSVALGAGVAARGIAGDSFKQQASGGAATRAASSSGGGGGSGSNEKQTIEIGRNQPGRNSSEPQRIEVMLNVRSNDSHIVDVVQDNYRNNGGVRNLFVEFANS